MFGLYTKRQYDYVERDRKKAESKAEFLRASLEELYKDQGTAFSFLINSLEKTQKELEQFKGMYERSEQVRKELVNQKMTLQSKIQSLEESNKGLREQLQDLRAKQPEGAMHLASFLKEGGDD